MPTLGAFVTRTCPAGHLFQKTSACPVCPQCEAARLEASPLPRIGAPATRALERAGVTRLDQLASWSRSRLLATHGVGPKAVAILEEALGARGMGLAAE